MIPKPFEVAFDMPGGNEPRRLLGTMIAYGFGNGLLQSDLAIAHSLGAAAVEIFPDWRALPDPEAIRSIAADSGLLIHSAHGCWGSQTIKASRVDLASLNVSIGSESVDEIRRCVDWLDRAGGTCLVIHPGGFSLDEEREARSSALSERLLVLSDHALGSQVKLCVENMPPGVEPGSAMADLARLVREIGRPNLGLALDTGHAHLSGTVEDETAQTGADHFTTHVHDNHGRKDAHLAPGEGTIDWRGWAEALDRIEYNGAIMLECIRHFRSFPDSINEGLRELLEILRGE